VNGPVAPQSNESSATKTRVRLNNAPAAHPVSTIEAFRHDETQTAPIRYSTLKTEAADAPGGW
jgi:hypothetical protein